MAAKLEVDPVLERCALTLSCIPFQLTCMLPLRAPRPPRSTFRGHTDKVTCVTFSPTMKQAVSGGLDNCLMVWNFRPQLRAYRFMGHTVRRGWLCQAGAGGGPHFQTSHLWLWLPPQAQVNDVSYSPDGKLIVSASHDRTVRLWQPTVRGDSSVMKGHAGAVRSARFSWDGLQLLTASDDKTAKLWSLPSKRFVCSLNGHSNWVRSAEFSPDARLVATGSDDKTVRLWDVEKHTSVHTYFDHCGCVGRDCRGLMHLCA